MDGRVKRGHDALEPASEKPTNRYRYKSQLFCLTKSETISIMFVTDGIDAPRPAAGRGEAVAV